MQKIKHTKNELKRQRNALKMFLRYLPTLVLKKQQLQLEIVKALNAIEDLDRRIKDFKEFINQWVAVFGEKVEINELISLDRWEVSDGNIAGIDMPIFKKIHFKEKRYDYMKTPFWVDAGIDAVKELMTLKIEKRILRKRLQIIKEELRITTQRVNLFEKVKIPETRENIRRIGIFLGDLQTAAVVTGKIAKRKIEEKLRG